MRLLALPVSRFTSNEVLDLLRRAGASRNACNWSRPTSICCACWLHDAGARWGLDAAHRVALGAPAENAYTWAWALDRLLLGHASGSAADIVGVAPWPETRRQRAGDARFAAAGLQEARPPATRARRMPHAAGALAATLLGQCSMSLFAESPADASRSPRAGGACARRSREFGRAGRGRGRVEGRFRRAWCAPGSRRRSATAMRARRSSPAASPSGAWCRCGCCRSR